MNEGSIPTEVRREFVAQHRERVARLTNGELHRLAREVRSHITTLSAHPEKAYREDVTAIFGELCYALGTSGDYPAIYLPNVSDSEWHEELITIGATLQQHAPRKFAAILRSIRADRRRCVIVFELDSEPVCPLSLDGAAA